MKLPWPFGRRITFVRIPTTTAPLTTHIYKRGPSVAEGPLVLYGRTPDGRYWHITVSTPMNLSPISHIITMDAPDENRPPFSDASVLIDVDTHTITDRRPAWFPSSPWLDTDQVTSISPMMVDQGTATSQARLRRAIPCPTSI